MDPLLVTQSLSPEEAQEFFLRIIGTYLCDIVFPLAEPDLPYEYIWTQSAFQARGRIDVIRRYISQPSIPIMLRRFDESLGKIADILEQGDTKLTTAEAGNTFIGILQRVQRLYQPLERDIGSPLGIDRTIKLCLDKLPDYEAMSIRPKDI